MSASTRQSITYDGITHELGGAENTWLDAKSGDSVTGSAGANNALYSGGDSTLIGGGGGGDNNFYVTNPLDTVVVSPDDGVDTVISWTSSYIAPGGVNNVLLQVAGAISGNTGDNVIMASGGNGAVPYGGPGETGTVTFTHTLYDGGGGNDVFIGDNSANDRFVVTQHAGHSTIVNFQSGIDLVELDNTAYTNFTQVEQHLTQDGADAVLDLGGGQTLRFADVAATDLQAGDFALPVSTTGMTLTFNENFNQFSASPMGDGTVWRTSFGVSGDWNYRSLTSNGEIGYYSDSSVGADPFTDTNGTLSIHAAVATTPNADNLPVTTGAITTAGTFSQEFGYFEMRAELPDGAGAWPCFWLMPTSGAWPPELDIFEVIGSDPGAVHMTVHSEETGSHTAVSQIALLDDLSSGYHTYAVDWEPDFITFYIDGNEVAQTVTPDDMKQPMYILASYAIGGANSWAGGADLSNLPADYNIDYIRAYATANTINVTQAPAVQAELAAGGTAYLPGTTEVGTQSAGTGTDTLVVKVSEDAYQGDAQFTVSVDGVQVGGTFTASASNALGEYDSIELHGNWGAEAHQVTVNFLNDAYGGSVAADRNLYVVGLEINGAAVPDASAALNAGGATSLAFSETSTIAPGTVLVDAQTVGSGSDTLMLKLSEDAGHGDAQFTVSIDGHQLGGTLIAHAANAAGEYETVSLSGDWGPGAHQVSVHFLDDASGTGATGLHVLGATYDGSNITAGTLDLASGGSGDIAFTDATAVSTPTGLLDTQTIGSGAHQLVLRIAEDAFQGDAQFTISLGGVQVGGVLTAHASHADGQYENIVIQGDNLLQAGSLSINFVNDAWDGGSGDRNLYLLDTATYDGASIQVNPMNLYYSSSQGVQAARGQAGLLLHISEDAYQGDAKFTVAVDGVQQGGVMTATAAHSAGNTQDFAFTGNWADGGQHTVQVTFLNDASGPNGDRNLHVDGFDTATSTSAVTHHSGGDLWWSQTMTFDHVVFG